MKIPSCSFLLLNCFWTFMAPSISKHHDAGSGKIYSTSEDDSFSLALLTPDEGTSDLSTASRCSYNCGRKGKKTHHQLQTVENPKNQRIFFQLNDKYFGQSLKNASDQTFNGNHHHHHHRKREKHHQTSHHHFSHHQHLHDHNHEWKTDLGKGSRKIRRHGKNHNAFHGNHHHFSQELQKQNQLQMVKEPTFDDSSPPYATAQLGSSAFLSCRIHDLEDKSVSWIRNRDAHILTVDRYTFIADSRFVSWFDAESETWTLQVKFIEKDDAGKYECQVSTEPKKSHFVTLAVIAPRVEIPGGSELHVRSGSDVMLKCVISRALAPPPHVFWYHEERRVLDGSLGGLVHQAPLTKVSKDSSVASLTIKNAKQKHAGNYTCAPAGLATTASVILHVLNGEHPAAMQHGSNIGTCNSKLYYKSQIFFAILVNLGFTKHLHVLL